MRPEAKKRQEKIESKTCSACSSTFGETSSPLWLQISVTQTFFENGESEAKPEEKDPKSQTQTRSHRLSLLGYK
jgi:hypothetical protein